MKLRDIALIVIGAVAVLAIGVLTYASAQAQADPQNPFVPSPTSPSPFAPTPTPVNPFVPTPTAPGNPFGDPDPTPDPWMYAWYDGFASPCREIIYIYDRVHSDVVATVDPEWADQVGPDYIDGWAAGIAFNHIARLITHDASHDSPTPWLGVDDDEARKGYQWCRDHIR